jgi:hypothetical protein
MKGIIAVALALLVIITNGILAHHYPTSGILGTPVIVGISSLIIVLGLRRAATIWKSCLVLFYAFLNDFLIQNYSGGAHGPKGESLISSYLFYGLITGFLILILGTFNSKDKLSHKLIAYAIFPLGVFLYWQIR